MMTHAWRASGIARALHKISVKMNDSKEGDRLRSAPGRRMWLECPLKMHGELHVHMRLIPTQCVSYWIFLKNMYLLPHRCNILEQANDFCRAHVQPVHHVCGGGADASA